MGSLKRKLAGQLSFLAAFLSGLMPLPQLNVLDRIYSSKYVKR